MSKISVNNSATSYITNKSSGSITKPATTSTKAATVSKPATTSNSTITSKSTTTSTKPVITSIAITKAPTSSVATKSPTSKEATSTAKPAATAKQVVAETVGKAVGTATKTASVANETTSSKSTSSTSTPLTLKLATSMINNIVNMAKTAVNSTTEKVNSTAKTISNQVANTVTKTASTTAVSTSNTTIKPTTSEVAKQASSVAIASNIGSSVTKMAAVPTATTMQSKPVMGSLVTSTNVSSVIAKSTNATVISTTSKMACPVAKTVNNVITTINTESKVEKVASGANGAINVAVVPKNTVAPIITTVKDIKEKVNASANTVSNNGTNTKMQNQLMINNNTNNITITNKVDNLTKNINNQQSNIEPLIKSKLKGDSGIWNNNMVNNKQLWDNVTKKKEKEYKETKNIETKLSYIGYNVGKVDGIKTNNTTYAIEQFQEDNDLTPTGKVDAKTNKVIDKVYKAEEIKNNDKELSKEQKLFVATVYGEAANCSDAGQEAVANVIMNRVDAGEWKKYDSVTEIIKYTGFDAYNCPNNPYNEAVEYLKNRDGSNKDIEKTISTVIDVYYDITEDNTDGAVLYYSPKAQEKMHQVYPNTYDEKPSWVNNKVKEVKLPGAKNDDFKFYKYK